jgi:hypothetical protein
MSIGCIASSKTKNRGGLGLDYILFKMNPGPAYFISVKSHPLLSLNRN